MEFGQGNRRDAVLQASLPTLAFFLPFFQRRGAAGGETSAGFLVGQWTLRPIRRPLRRIEPRSSAAGAWKHVLLVSTHSASLSVDSSFGCLSRCSCQVVGWLLQLAVLGGYYRVLGSLIGSGLIHGTGRSCNNHDGCNNLIHTAGIWRVCSYAARLKSCGLNLAGSPGLHLMGWYIHTL